MGLSSLGICAHSCPFTPSRRSRPPGHPRHDRPRPRHHTSTTLRRPEATGAVPPCRSIGNRPHRTRAKKVPQGCARHPLVPTIRSVPGTMPCYDGTHQNPRPRTGTHRKTRAGGTLPRRRATAAYPIGRSHADSRTTACRRIVSRCNNAQPDRGSKSRPPSAHGAGWRVLYKAICANLCVLNGRSPSAHPWGLYASRHAMA